MNLKNLLLYAGAEKEDYAAVKDAIWESNRKNLTAFSLIAAVGLAVLTMGSYFSPQLAESRTVYIIGAVITICMAALADKVAPRAKHLTLVLVYVFVELLLLFGIALGTLVDPNHASASFGILLFAAPLLFTDSPLRMIAVCLLNVVLYFVLAANTQAPDMLAFNKSVIIPYGLVSFIVCAIMMRVKTERHVLEQRNHLLSESDQLSGMLNRRSYEKHIAVLQDAGHGSSLKMCALDINGLKEVNDNLGHQAGDELICGAANVITSVFGPYGKCYRIGGDEFAAILEGYSPNADELKAQLTKECEAFKGEFVDSLHISVGIETARPGDSAQVTMARADSTMYDNKAEYYKSAGKDRRAR
ncbi:MAG: GGDEF domain-containing protein [Coriobacteriia bacterium]|nr:GGDEF domain-containing protein [Coriobacteriia bacterium]